MKLLILATLTLFSQIAMAQNHDTLPFGTTYTLTKNITIPIGAGLLYFYKGQVSTDSALVTDAGASEYCQMGLSGADLKKVRQLSAGRKFESLPAHDFSLLTTNGSDFYMAFYCFKAAGPSAGGGILWMPLAQGEYTGAIKRHLLKNGLFILGSTEKVSPSPNEFH